MSQEIITTTYAISATEENYLALAMRHGRQATISQDGEQIENPTPYVKYAQDRFNKSVIQDRLSSEIYEINAYKVQDAIKELQEQANKAAEQMVAQQ